MSEELKNKSNSACHSERSEESHQTDSSKDSSVTSFPQDDNVRRSVSRSVSACGENCTTHAPSSFTPTNPLRWASPGAPVCHSERSEEKVKTHFASLREQAEELRKEFPDFRLSEALKDESFIRMTAPAVGVDLRRAYFALNREKLESMAERRGAEAAKAAFARSLRENAARPVEGGSSAAAELRTDYRAMSGKSRAELKRQIRDAAARGKKIYP